MKARPSLAAIAALLLALGLYWGMGLAQLRLPGLQYDEAADAVPAMDVLLGHAPRAMGTITIFGKPLPLMMLHHIGPSSIYTSLVGMGMFGISVEGLRISQLCVGAVALVVLWWMGRSWFNEHTASIAVLLCATAPAFVWWSRAGANWTVPLLPLALGFAMALRKSAASRHLMARDAALLTERRRMRTWMNFGIVGLLFGLGFTTKILFVWLLGPIALTALIAYKPRGVLAHLRTVSWQAWLSLLMGLALGLSPFILHNLRPSTFLATFKFISNNAAQTQLYGHNNLDFLNNLAQVSSEFLRMMGGDTLVFHAPSGLPLSAITLVISLLYTVWRLIRHKAETSHATLRLFLLLCVVVVLPLSTVSTSSIGATYLFIIVPFAWLLIALALNDLFVFAQAKSWLAFALVGILCANHIVTNLFIQRFFAQTGGQELWSDAIYDVATSLQTNYPNKKIIAMDWGFARNLNLLSHDQINIGEAFEYILRPPPTYEDLCISLLREPQNIYLFRPEDKAVFHGRWRIFERAALKTRKQLVLLQAFAERNGITNTLLYEARNAQPQFDIPSLAQPRNATFETAITLLGGTARYDQDNHEVAITLHWQANATALPNDTVLLHLVDAATGQVVLTGDQQPLYGSYPFTNWQPNEVVTDPHWIALPDNFKPGIYQVRVGLYDTQTGNRRAIADPQNDAAGNSLMLQLVEIR